MRETWQLIVPLLKHWQKCRMTPFVKLIGGIIFIWRDLFKARNTSDVFLGQS
jgi:hypothetical protein